MKHLSRDEMKKVIGGNAPPSSCHCNGSVGAWDYINTPNCLSWLSDISTYCGSGSGSCSGSCSIG